ncbi:hypothetical protein GOP47_0011107 [Adiantum capillus-veneris]|uniref:Protein kinase domain-containing protein n=1 Tax=Adiantum capillus-veneris TaxID=13818 RepID=A0A9D4USK2_ADICA|nr:hypothetical protein GOP47_0011107 [Adiantum capillus-veneris]
MVSTSCLAACALNLAFLFLVFLPQSALADLDGDAQALLAFKANVTNSGNLLSWNASNTASVCTWKGVTCGNGSSSSSSSSQRVVELRLPGSSLLGPIPAQTLGRLDALRVLSLRKNKLSGTLPSDLANCSSLRVVNLKNNSFSGALLLDFSAWQLLENLDLSSNSFIGQIPMSLVNLTHLTSLFLEENAFSGTIPSIDTPTLRSFNVTSNSLNGSIPSSLSNFTVNSFAGNLDLCGTPLPECQQVQSPAGAPAPGDSFDEQSDNDGNKLGAGAIVGIVLGAVAAATVAVSVCCLLIVRKNAKQEPADDAMYAEGRADFDARNKSRAMSRKASGKSGEKDQGNLVLNNNNRLIFMGNAKQTYDLDDLLRASAEVLGKGSLGTSYKANINDGHSICVKRFREVATDREHTCKHIEMLGALQHPNLVSLRAYFFAPKGKLLVTDYMPKGSLSSLLHGNKREARDPLDWETRLAIAEGAAKGLVFLHSKKVVHGNIKSSNVVMDAEGQAHLTDYSLLQLVPLSTEPGVTIKPNAFTPPEARGDLRKVAYKGDVYAFGVLLLELVTGKSPNSGSLTQGGTNIDRLVQWVQAHFPHDIESVLDPRLSDLTNNHVQEEMISLAQIAMPCVSILPEKRPHMVEVVSSVSNLRKREVGPDSSDFYFTQAE